MNVQLMLQDAARIESIDKDDEKEDKVIHKVLKTKEDIINHLKGIS